jgi:hypothetical protein
VISCLLAFSTNPTCITLFQMHATSPSYLNLLDLSLRSASCCVSLYCLLLSVRTQQLTTTYLHHMCKWVY